MNFMKSGAGSLIGGLFAYRGHMPKAFLHLDAPPLGQHYWCLFCQLSRWLISDSRYNSPSP
jgi:hypothetical protein